MNISLRADVSLFLCWKRRSEEVRLFTIPYFFPNIGRALTDTIRTAILSYHIVEVTFPRATKKIGDGWRGLFRESHGNFQFGQGKLVVSFWKWNYQLNWIKSKLFGLLAGNCDTIEQVLILKFGLGPGSYRDSRETGSSRPDRGNNHNPKDPLSWNKLLKGLLWSCAVTTYSYDDQGKNP